MTFPVLSGHIPRRPRHDLVLYLILLTFSLFFHVTHAQLTSPGVPTQQHQQILNQEGPKDVQETADEASSNVSQLTERLPLVSNENGSGELDAGSPTPADGVTGPLEFDSNDTSEGDELSPVPQDLGIDNTDADKLPTVPGNNSEDGTGSNVTDGKEGEGATDMAEISDDSDVGGSEANRVLQKTETDGMDSDDVADVPDSTDNGATGGEDAWAVSANSQNNIPADIGVPAVPTDADDTDDSSSASGEVPRAAGIPVTDSEDGIDIAQDDSDANNVANGPERASFDSTDAIDLSIIPGNAGDSRTSGNASGGVPEVTLVDGTEGNDDTGEPQDAAGAKNITTVLQNTDSSDKNGDTGDTPSGDVEMGTMGGNDRGVEPTDGGGHVEAGNDLSAASRNTENIGASASGRSDAPQDIGNVPTDSNSAASIPPDSVDGDPDDLVAAPPTDDDAGDGEDENAGTPVKDVADVEGPIESRGVEKPRAGDFSATPLPDVEEEEQVQQTVQGREGASQEEAVDRPEPEMALLEGEEQNSSTVNSVSGQNREHGLPNEGKNETISETLVGNGSRNAVERSDAEGVVAHMPGLRLGGNQRARLPEGSSQPVIPNPSPPWHPRQGPPVIGDSDKQHPLQGFARDVNDDISELPPAGTESEILGDSTPGRAKAEMDNAQEDDSVAAQQERSFGGPEASDLQTERPDRTSPVPEDDKSSSGHPEGVVGSSEGDNVRSERPGGDAPGTGDVVAEAEQFGEAGNVLGEEGKRSVQLGTEPSDSAQEEVLRTSEPVTTVNDTLGERPQTGQPDPNEVASDGVGSRADLLGAAVKGPQEDNSETGEVERILPGPEVGDPSAEETAPLVTSPPEDIRETGQTTGSVLSPEGAKQGAEKLAQDEPGAVESGSGTGRQEERVNSTGSGGQTEQTPTAVDRPQEEQPQHEQPQDGDPDVEDQDSGEDQLGLPVISQVEDGPENELAQTNVTGAGVSRSRVEPPGTTSDSLRTQPLMEDMRGPGVNGSLADERVASVGSPQDDSQTKPGEEGTFGPGDNVVGTSQLGEVVDDEYGSNRSEAVVNSTGDDIRQTERAEGHVSAKPENSPGASQQFAAVNLPEEEDDVIPDPPTPSPAVTPGPPQPLEVAPADDGAAMIGSRPERQGVNAGARNTSDAAAGGPAGARVPRVNDPFVPVQRSEHQKGHQESPFDQVAGGDGVQPPESPDSATDPDARPTPIPDAGDPLGDSPVEVSNDVVQIPPDGEGRLDATGPDFDEGQGDVSGDTGDSPADIGQAEDGNAEEDPETDATRESVALLAEAPREPPVGTNGGATGGVNTTAPMPLDRPAMSVPEAAIEAPAPSLDAKDDVLVDARSSASGLQQDIDVAPSPMAKPVQEAPSNGVPDPPSPAGGDSAAQPAKPSPSPQARGRQGGEPEIIADEMSRTFPVEGESAPNTPGAGPIDGKDTIAGTTENSTAQIPPPGGANAEDEPETDETEGSVAFPVEASEELRADTGGTGSQDDPVSAPSPMLPPTSPTPQPPGGSPTTSEGADGNVVVDVPEPADNVSEDPKPQQGRSESFVDQLMSGDGVQSSDSSESTTNPDAESRPVADTSNPQVDSNSVTQGRPAEEGTVDATEPSFDGRQGDITGGTGDPPAGVRTTEGVNVEDEPESNEAEESVALPAETSEELPADTSGDSELDGDETTPLLTAPPAAQVVQPPSAAPGSSVDNAEAVVGSPSTGDAGNESEDAEVQGPEGRPVQEVTEVPRNSTGSGALVQDGSNAGEDGSEELVDAATPGTSGAGGETLPGGSDEALSGNSPSLSDDQDQVARVSEDGHSVEGHDRVQVPGKLSEVVGGELPPESTADKGLEAVGTSEGGIDVPDSGNGEAAESADELGDKPDVGTPGGAEVSGGAAAGAENRFVERLLSEEPVSSGEGTPVGTGEGQSAPGDDSMSFSEQVIGGSVDTSSMERMPDLPDAGKPPAGPATNNIETIFPDPVSGVGDAAKVPTAAEVNADTDPIYEPGSKSTSIDAVGFGTREPGTPPQIYVPSVPSTAVKMTKEEHKGETIVKTVMGIAVVACAAAALVLIRRRRPDETLKKMERGRKSAEKVTGTGGRFSRVEGELDSPPVARTYPPTTSAGAGSEHPSEPMPVYEPYLYQQRAGVASPKPQYYTIPTPSYSPHATIPQPPPLRSDEHASVYSIAWSESPCSEVSSRSSVNSAVWRAWNKMKEEKRISSVFRHEDVDVKDEWPRVPIVLDDARKSGDRASLGEAFSPRSDGLGLQGPTGFAQVLVPVVSSGRAGTRVEGAGDVSSRVADVNSRPESLVSETGTLGVPLPNPSARVRGPADSIAERKSAISDFQASMFIPLGNGLNTDRIGLDPAGELGAPTSSTGPRNFAPTPPSRVLSGGSTPLPRHFPPSSTSEHVPLPSSAWSHPSTTSTPTASASSSIGFRDSHTTFSSDDTGPSPVPRTHDASNLSLSPSGRHRSLMSVEMDRLGKFMDRQLAEPFPEMHREGQQEEEDEGYGLFGDEE